MTGRRWAVVGVGGVGGLYAARLHAAGREVHLVARSDAGALRSGGLHLRSPLGDVHARLPVHETAETVPEVDVVALATKTTATAAAGVARAIAVADLVLGRWRKLVWNVPFNGLAVVLRSRTDEMLADPVVTARVRALMDEVRLGAAAQGREIPAAFVDEMIATTRGMTPYAPSMRLDFDAGRPLELDAIYAAPLAAALAAGVDLPETAALLDELRALSVG